MFVGAADSISPRQSVAELCCVCEHVILLCPLLGELRKIKRARRELAAGSLQRNTQLPACCSAHRITIFTLSPLSSFPQLPRDSLPSSQGSRCGQEASEFAQVGLGVQRTTNGQDSV